MPDDDFDDDDDGGDVKGRAAALAAALELRERIRDLVANGRRRDGTTPLSNVAIAARLGCRVELVREVRAEMAVEAAG